MMRRFEVRGRVSALSVCVGVCVCVAKPVTVELRCHATALILVIGKAQFRRAMLSCDSSCKFSRMLVINPVT